MSRATRQEIAFAVCWVRRAALALTDEARRAERAALAAEQNGHRSMQARCEERVEGCRRARAMLTEIMLEMDDGGRE